MNRDRIENDELLERATKALRDTPVPPGPPEDVLALVCCLDGQAHSGGQSPVAGTRRFPMKRLLSIAAAVVLFLGLAGVAYFFLGRSATVAFADVQRQIERIETMKWRMSMAVTYPKPGKIEMKCFYKEPGLMRQEVVLSSTGEKVVATVDYQTGKVLSLVPAEKTAIVLDMGQMPEAARKRNRNFVAEMKKTIQGNAEELGTKQVNGRQAKGFRVTKNAQTMDIWVDPKSGSPVEIDMSIPGIGSMTMSDFQTGMELDDSLFSLTVPEGYKQMNLQMPMGNITESDLVAGLRRLAELNSKQFPETLMPTTDILKQIKDQEASSKGLSEEEASQKALELVAPMVRMNLFIQSVKDFHYVGGGVALGDAGRIICRYKVTDKVKCGGPGPYRVVYGDLRIEDAPAEEPPATSPATAP
jgi:outer membrane lipoprotein-sorting protein